MSLCLGQRTSVELLLNLGLLALLGAYLLQNELGVLNGERTREGGHTPIPDFGGHVYSIRIFQGNRWG